MSLLQSWWFKLYTKNILFTLLRNLAICIGVDIAVVSFGGPLATLCVFLVLIYPVTFYLENNKGSFRGNIEFHKMSIPFTALKKAFITHTLICVFAIFGFVGLHVVLSSLLGGFFSIPGIKSDFTSIRPYQIIFFLSAAFFFLIYTMYLSKDSKYKFYDKPKSVLKNILSFVIFSALGILYMSLTLHFNFSQTLNIFVPIAGVFLATTLFQNKAIFHQCKPKGRKRDVIKFFGMAHTICFSIYMLSAQFAKSDLLNSNLKPQERAAAFEFLDGFSPAIDEETFFAIHTHLGGYSKQVLYSQLAFPASHVGVAYFMKDGEKGFWPLWDMIQHGKLDKAFLVELYDHMEQNPAFWNKSTYTFQLKYISFLKWPKDEMLPERFIAAKLSSKNDFKNAVAEAKKNRLNRKAASENN